MEPVPGSRCCPSDEPNPVCRIVGQYLDSASSPVTKQTGTSISIADLTRPWSATVMLKVFAQCWRRQSGLPLKLAAHCPEFLLSSPQAPMEA
jgi:hypothetical protein